MNENTQDSTVQIEFNKVRDLVIQGVEQATKGKPKDFNEVCERLERKYKDAVLQH
jgi:hypothetical protein